MRGGESIGKIKKKFPVSFVASFISSFLFLYVTQRMISDVWDAVIQISMFFSLLGLGFLDPKQRGKDAHPEEQEQHDSGSPGDDDTELQEGA